MDREKLAQKLKKIVEVETECAEHEAICHKWPENCACLRIARAALAVAEAELVAPLRAEVVRLREMLDAIPTSAELPAYLWRKILDERDARAALEAPHDPA